MDAVLKFLSQIRAVWSGLSTIHRWLAIGVLSCLLVSSVAVYVISTSIEYVPLVGGLAVEDSGPILSQLESASIPYRLESGGTVILVPKEQLAKARVELASKGSMSRGGRGYELFDDMSLGATPFVQNVTYLRALQAELARSIMQLEPVASARVLIARAEPTPFIRDQQPTTASVVIKLKPGTGISRSMAAGIVSLVSRSVEGLRPENVTVVDSSGRLLSEPSKNSEGLTASELEVRRELEDYLSSKAEELLARHLGAGRALVRVSADLSRQKIRETRESYSPEERAVRSEQIVSSESGGGSSPRGVAGVASNTGTQPVSTTVNNSRTREETTYTDYLVSKTTREMESRVGDLQRLSVAVVVDLSPREGAEVISIKEVEEIVKQAVGFQTGRDSIKVTNAALTGELPPPEPAGPTLVEQAHAYVQLARNASVVVAFVFLALTVFMLARRLTVLTLPSRPPTLSAVPTTGDEDRNRFVELALADPKALADVLSALLRGRPETTPMETGEAT